MRRHRGDIDFSTPVITFDDDDERCEDETKIHTYIILHTVIFFCDV
jgi:hypothetical protein